MNPLVARGLPVDRLRAVHGQAGAGRRQARGRWAGTGKIECGLHDPVTASRRCDALDALESEAIHIFREVAGEFDRPVILFSGGKDSTLLVHLAVKAFAPAPVPFPLLHVDTGHNYPEVIDFRDRLVERLGPAPGGRARPGLDRRRPAGRARRTAPATRCRPCRCSTRSTSTGSTRCSAAGAATRSAPGPRSGSSRLRDAFGRWDPRSQRPELWNLYNGRHAPGEHVRVFPISNWTELDVWRYIQREDIELPSIYYAHQREVFRRDGMWLAEGPWGGPRGAEALRDDDRALPHRRRRLVHRRRRVRRRRTVDEIIAEVMASRLTERGATRADDRLSEAAMEDRKREGYF